ncbi:MAG TPA: DNA gyrase C-terminal beta-propeller domain-containing protein, partial [Caulobacterales bacterium]|nr:DNA gyrase C-terminal beta-propeller domain-containing protein [Caulobacterales bacterium]
AFVVHAQTTDKIVLFASDGRAFTLSGDKLPGGRGQGEPIRLQIDLGEDDQAIALFVHRPGTKRLLASARGDGFIVAEDELIASKRSGKQVLNIDAKGRAMVAAPAGGDHVAVIGKNRKLLVFKAEELPEMARGKGVKLQSYKDGGLLDAITFNAADGLEWIDSAGRSRAVPDWKNWRGKRAQAGLMAPRGFSRSGKFRGD